MSVFFIGECLFSNEYLFLNIFLLDELMNRAKFLHKGTYHMFDFTINVELTCLSLL